MNTATTTPLTLDDGFFSRRRPLDWLFAAAGASPAACSRSARYAAHMDVYEKGILLGSDAGGHLARLVLAAAAGA